VWRCELNREALQIELLGLDPKREQLGEDAEYISLNCPFTIKRRGREVRIVVSAGEISKPQGVPSLMKAVARSRDWADLIVAGKARTIDDLVKISGLNKRYVRRIMHCAALSPQLLEAILNGRQPVDLTVMRLTQNLPLDWHEQHLD
jgi:site-specific DNA recombinase